VNLRINGRVALVTGASAGLGEAVALELAREGATVALAARRANLLDAVALKAEEAGAKSARGFVADFDDRDAVRKLVSDVERAYGKIDILVVNGGGPKPGSFLDMSIDDWDRAYNGKLRAPLELVYATVPAMRNRLGTRRCVDVDDGEGAVADTRAVQRVPNGADFGPENAVDRGCSRRRHVERDRDWKIPHEPFARVVRW